MLPEQYAHSSAWLNTLSQNLLQQSDCTAQVSANYAAILLQFLQAYGADSAQLLERAAIGESLIGDPAGKISGAQYLALLAQALQLTGDPAFGLRYGQRLNISTHGLLGYAVMSCPRLDKAAELAMKFIQIRNQLVSIAFAMNEVAPAQTELAITFEVAISEVALYRVEVDISLSSLTAVWHELFGDIKDIAAVHFSYPQPQNLEPYRQLFADIPLFFSMADNRMCFNGDAFDRMTRISDPTLTRIAEQQCENLLQSLNAAKLQSDLVLSIRQLLLRSPGNFLSVQEVAASLNMTVRTLARKMAKEGTTFQRVLDGVREDLALQCLRHSQWSVDDIALMLGYSDAANFSRAFKRWLGVSPGAYRTNAL